MAIATINPATGETLEEFEPFSPEEIDRRLGLADEAFRALGRTSFDTRAEWMRAAADLLDADINDLARTVTTEMGKTLQSARAEIAKCAMGMRFFATHAQRFLADEPLDNPDSVGASRAYVSYQPLGPILAVMPWNFPVWQVIRFAAPALMAGNTGVLKHASNVPRTALYLDRLFTRAGFPEGAFAALLIGSTDVEQVLLDPRIRAATLTGSDAAGSSVGLIAGSQVKKTVLELGGSDPFVVMPSADVDQAVRVGVTARCQNNGQSCIAAKRFLVHEDCFDEFTDRFVERMADLRIGDPMADDTDLGPLATEVGRDGVEQVVADAVGKGAKVLCGGETPDRPGWWYPPTVITDVTPAMRMYDEEVFGPVAQIHRVGSVEDAIALANATPYGLGSSVWTHDPAEQAEFARSIESGQVFVNGMVVSYPQLPFGGVKRSGYGRELAAYGIREFCNTKTVWAA
ncbi:NADP-dependent succinic semialdehyde dehydrogenase [Actinopolymorpha alba]|uniref:NADP-dependent succinic semialdehyde dehydrogenase n=1 Tax=Actinopolymorpha alba TaxID=533267 RepID=UPI00037B5794|nr:NADP-dependent succinic semialdehyde dehydrogenase [Actinopolymorpha alba]